MIYPWKANVHILGATPLLIHNGRTASPLDVYAKKMKALTSKRKKTEEDIKHLLEIQFEGALYWNDSIGLYMPTENILAALLKAARKHKLGPKISGFIFNEAIGFPIITNNHNSFNKLLTDKNNKFIKTVTIQRSKTLSCRPIFNNWEIKFNFHIDEEELNLDDVKMLLSTMANRIGLGVWTPSHPKPGTFGKFMIKELTFSNEKTGEIKRYAVKDL